MAEAAIAMTALASAWAMSRKKPDSKPQPAIQPMPINYPVFKRVNTSNPNKYAQPANQTTDKFFQKDCSTTPSGATFVSLTGETVKDSELTHNNCVPFFGARVKGASAGDNIGNSILDSMSGTGSQQNTKKELAPLFAPQKDVHWTHGMPNNTDFMLSRQIPSSRMANVKPWAEERIGPGLGNNPNSLGGGYNSAVQDRNAWLPKTVSELRVQTNPKQTFGLKGYEGPAISNIKEPTTTEMQGVVNKNRPDTSYQLGPSRWFTTTGAEKGQTRRSEILLQPQDRGICSRDYYGNSQSDTKATYINSYSDNSNKVSFCPEQLGPAMGTELPRSSTLEGYENKCNNRATSRHTTTLGPLKSAVDAIVAPVMDVIRHTRKSNTVGNARMLGNPTTTVSGASMDNSQNRLKTTLSEQTGGLLGTTHLNVQPMSQGKVNMSCDAPRVQHRTSTNVCTTGIAAPAASGPIFAMNKGIGRTPNTRKQTTPYFPAMQGTTARQSGSESKVKIADRGNYNSEHLHNTLGTHGNASANTHQRWAPLKAPSVSQTYVGFTKMTKVRDYERWSCDNGRQIDSNLLTAFKANPYTHSLSSC
tara:strand:+ start:2563 stop:4326 length:1764 start_codon:yes stop_codon:yes gene_type:complete